MDEKRISKQALNWRPEGTVEDGGRPRLNQREVVYEGVGGGGGGTWLRFTPQGINSFFGTNSISFRGSMLWSSTPVAIKSSNAGSGFCKNITN